MNKNFFSINNYLISPPLGWSVLMWRVFCITTCVYQDSVLIILYNYRHVIECVQVCMHMCVRVHFLYMDMYTIVNLPKLNAHHYSTVCVYTVCVYVEIRTM